MNRDPYSHYTGTDMFADLDGDNVIEALRAAIRCKTVSYEDVGRMDGSTFLALHEVFQRHFPLVHKHLKREVINGWSLLYHWPGSDESLDPILLMSHLDVVPVTEGTLDEWQHGPFSGDLDENGVIWGRGAVDIKGQVVAELAAVEYLLARGMRPKRGVYLSFGHDEETMGVDGALAIMHLLKDRGVHLEFVLDEGGGFESGAAFGAPDALLAKVDVFEKGYADIKVEADSRGGHSSAPGPSTSLGAVCKAVGRIEEAPFPASISPVLEEFLKSIAPHVTEEPMKGYLADFGNNRDEICRLLMADRHLAPLVHTTTAATMLSGGSAAPNVLPQRVEAVINFRTAAGDSCDYVVDYCKQAAGDAGVEIAMTKGLDPSKISKTDSLGFTALRAAAAKFYKGVTMVPGLVTGGTDCRYFEDICDCCYRFRPILEDPAMHATAHTVNERCSAQGLLQGTRFLIELIASTCA